MNLIEDISTLLQQGLTSHVKALIQQALDEKVPAKEILEQGLLGGMNIIGEKFKKNEVFIPDVILAARAMNQGIELLRPYLVAGTSADVKSKGTVVLGTVKGDLHDIGKNLVKMMMEGKGLKVVDLGIDVSVEKYIEAARKHNAQIIACAALLTTTMFHVRSIVEAVKVSTISASVKVMVGGAPVTQNFANSIGADIYATDAVTAAELALNVCTREFVA